MTFPEPIKISGFGFTSANNLPHLDPAEVEIYCFAEKKDPISKLKTLRKFMSHKF